MMIMRPKQKQTGVGKLLMLDSNANFPLESASFSRESSIFCW